MIMPTGVVHVAQAPGGSAELAGIGIFTTDWMDLCLLRRQPGWAPQQGRAPQPEPAADLPAYYAGEQILVGDLVQESVDQALYRFIAGVHPPGQPPDAYDHIEAYSAEQSEHGTCTMTWPGAHPSVRDQIFSLYDLTWDDLVLVRRGPPYPWML
jgi:hypothetical protein